jgi:hypothetical protein
VVPRMQMEWNPALEHRLQDLEKRAGWRWVGYCVVILALAVVPVGSLAIAATGTAWMDEDPRGILTVLGVLAGLFLILGLIFALPAEKAAKQARELRVQKEAAPGASPHQAAEPPRT